MRKIDLNDTYFEALVLESQIQKKINFHVGGCNLSDALSLFGLRRKIRY